MEEECVVASTKGGLAYVSLKKATQACGGCKACVFGKNKSKTIAAVIDLSHQSNTKCEAGDTVLVRLLDAEIKSASFILYLLPIIFLFIGFFVGRLFKSEIIAALFALLFCVASFALIWLIDKQFRKKKYMPSVIKIINKGGNK